MRRAIVRVNREAAGYLVQESPEGTFTFEYLSEYRGSPVSLTMPVREEPYRFDRFPSFFDGLLPEGFQLEALLRAHKLDRTDFMGQILRVGSDLVGFVTVEEDRS